MTNANKTPAGFPCDCHGEYLNCCGFFPGVGNVRLCSPCLHGKKVRVMATVVIDGEPCCAGCAAMFAAALKEVA